jgi:hypothetical protein
MNEAKFSGRRVVTRMNDQGRSLIGLDGPRRNDRILARRRSPREWTDLAGPLDRKSLADLGAGPIRLGPPSGGVKVRWFTVTPSPVGVPQAEIEKRVAEAFHAIGGDHSRSDLSKGPAMHLTSTIDRRYRSHQWKRPAGSR